MSTVIAFPAARERAERAASARGRSELSGPRIVILPVVRIERHGDVAAPVHPRAERVRAPLGAGPAGRHG